MVARFFRLGEKEKKNEKLCEELPRINEQVYPPSHSESFTNALQGMVFKLSAKEKQNHTQSFSSILTDCLLPIKTPGWGFTGCTLVPTRAVLLCEGLGAG